MSFDRFRVQQFVENKLGCSYLLEIHEGKSPLKRDQNRYRNDHVAAINMHKDIAGENDILRTNTISGSGVYEWLMDKRHQVNYRQRTFYEPDYADFFHVLENMRENKELESLLIKYINDSSYMYCFDPEHACIAVPIKRALLTKNELKSSGVDSIPKRIYNVLKEQLSFCSSNKSSVFKLIDL